jgi:hypothetical protein
VVVDCSPVVVAARKSVVIRSASVSSIGSNLEPVGAENPVMSCDLHILVDEATEPVAS